VWPICGLCLEEWVQDASITEIACYGLNTINKTFDVRFESADHGHYSAVKADAATNLTMVKYWVNFLTEKAQDDFISDIALYGLNIRNEACDVRYESADHGHYSAAEVDAATDLTMVTDRINFLTI
jgi:hypothetical protein